MWFSAIGNIGPRKMPIIETEIAAAVKDGTSQTINWKLCEYYQMSIKQNYSGVKLTTSRGGYKRRRN